MAHLHNFIHKHHCTIHENTMYILPYRKRSRIQLLPLHQFSLADAGGISINQKEHNAISES